MYSTNRTQAIPKEEDLAAPNTGSNVILTHSPNTSLASSIITNHELIPHCSEGNSLELLQKRAEEVLNSASHSFSTGNLANELSYRTSVFYNSDNHETNDLAHKHCCRFCGKGFGSDSALQIHLRSHTGERPFRCLVCGTRFTTNGNLKVHYQRHLDSRNSIDSMIIASRNRPQHRLTSSDANIIVREQQKDATSIHVINQFRRTNADPQPFVQNIFGPKSPSVRKKSWERCMEIVHTPLASGLQKDEAFRVNPNKCPICNRLLSCRSALIQHYRTHTGERAFKCLICGRKFTTKGNLKTHIAIHKLNPPLSQVHKCKICNRKYSTLQALRQHILTHTGAPTEMTIDQIRAAEVLDSMGIDLFGSTSSFGEQSETPYREYSSASEHQQAEQNAILNKNVVLFESDREQIPTNKVKINDEKSKINDSNSFLLSNSDYSKRSDTCYTSQSVFLPKIYPIFKSLPASTTSIFTGDSILLPGYYLPLGLSTGTEVKSIFISSTGDYFRQFLCRCSR